jgi:unsaturated rhamnogalacturonyl hydrolase
MKHLLSFHLGLLAGVALLSTGCQHTAVDSASGQFNGATPLEWSVRMAQAEIARRGDSLVWTEGGRVKWDYAAGLFTLSLLKLNEPVPDPAYAQFSRDVIGSFIQEDGTIRTCRREDFNIDNLNPGKTVLALWDLTKEERYRKAAVLLRDQLTDHPRTPEGGFWHKQRYPSQMWLDGLYMGAPFYAEYARRFGPDADFDDVARQFRLMGQHAYDARSGLYYHGWDAAKNPEWANPVTGTSSNFWGRGLGWFSMALVDVLDFFPEQHAARAELVRMLNQVCAGVVRHQDPSSHLWWQVLDQGGRAGNYLEATASSMFVYTLAKGVNRGYLPRHYAEPARQGYAALVDRFLRFDADGRVSLTACCLVAGLGYGRDGSYAYYLREPVVDNDLKGVGPFILAGIEMQGLLRLQMAVRPIAAAPKDGAAGDSTKLEW